MIIYPLYPKVKDVEISRRHVCLNEECKKDVYVEIELEQSVEVDEFDVDVILEVLKEEIGIDTSRILIGWDTDESGRVTRVMIYVDDESMAGSVSSKITSLFPHVKRAQIVVNGDYLSCASVTFVERMSTIVILLFYILQM